MHFVRGNEGEGILTNDGEQKSTLKLTEKEPPLRIFTNQELAKYDGSDPNLPIYLAIKGVVFDVSEGKDFYGKGAGYNALAGRDCTRAVALWSLDEDDMISDVTGLTNEQLTGLEKVYNEVYKAKYPIAGHMSFNVVRDNATPFHTEEL